MFSGQRAAGDRRHILRDVYEENKQIADRTPHRGRNRRRTVVTGFGGVVIFVVLLSLAVDYMSRESGAPTADAVEVLSQPAPSKRVIPAITSDTLSGSSVLPDARAYDSIGNGSIPLAGLFDLHVRTIVIDAGHGGRDPGALGSDGLMEKEITLDVARRLSRRLEAASKYRVEMTRRSDSTISLRSRAEFANQTNADLFVSIHVNYFPSEPVYALETYYFGPQADASGLRLAELENRNSDYSVAEFNVMIKRIGDRIKLQESQRLASHVQQSLFRNTRQVNRNVHDWGVKTAPFVVLVGTTAPGILAEIGVISNRDEEARLNTPEFREQLAMFLEEGIVNYLVELSHQEAPKEGESNHATQEADRE